MTYNFTFDTAECIELRKQVLRFYGDLVGRSIPNVIDEKEPWADVANDFQLIMYIYMMIHANWQVEQAAAMKDAKGKRIIKGEACNILAYYRKDYQRIKAYFPMNNATFVSQYADVDEAMEDSMERLTQQTYYPMLNNILQSTKDCNSEVAQCCARLITAVCFMVMAVQTGMHDTHKVPSPLFKQIVDRLCRLTCYVVFANHSNILMNDKTLEDNCAACRNVMQNIAQPMMVAIQEHAKSLDLYHYVKQADLTMTQFRELKAKVQRATKRTIVQP